MSACDEFSGRIQLLVDGELTGAEKDETLEHVAGCVACHETLEELQRFSAVLRSAGQPPAPEELRSRIEKMLAADAAKQQGGETRGALLAMPGAPVSQRVVRRSFVGRFGAIAAVLIVAVGLVSVVLLFQREARARRFVDVAIAEHQGLINGSVPLDIVSDSPEAMRSWFSRRVSFPFRMPNSGIASEDRAKYVLQGGRLVSYQGKQVALLGFKMSNETISILVGSDQQAKATGGTTSYSGGIRFHTTDRDHHHVVTWDTRGLTYVLVSERPMMGRSCGACHEGASNRNAIAGLNSTRRVHGDDLIPELVAMMTARHGMAAARGAGPFGRRSGRDAHNRIAHPGLPSHWVIPVSVWHVPQSSRRHEQANNLAQVGDLSPATAFPDLSQASHEIE